MKLRILVAFSSLIYSGLLPAQVPNLVNLPITKIYAIQQGFDDNDSIEIPVFGYLPDTCHKVERGIAQINPSTKKITVSVSGIIRKDEVCLEILTPFLEVISVGILKAGTYQLKSSGDVSVASSLEVKKHTTDQRDDYIYAPVDSVELDRTPTSLAASDQLTLKGTYPYMLRGCMRIVEVKSTSFNNEVLVVQPVVNILDDQQCNPSDVDSYNRFTYKVSLPSSVIGERGVVHVRTLNGRALNKLVDFTQGPR